jgi:hypothetical protein
VPEEVFWQSFYAADCIVEKLKCAKENRESIAEFGSGYGTFTFLLAKRGASRCSSGCTSGNDFPSAPSSPLLHSPSSWVTACRVDGGVVIQGLAAANCITIEGFLQHNRRQSKKTAQSWRLSAGLPAYAHEPAQTTTRRKNQNQ